MNLRTFGRFFLVLLATSTMTGAAEPSRDLGSSNRLDRLSARSDVVALVKVAAIDFIGKPTKIEDGQIVIDVFRYGRLVTLQLVDLYSLKGQVRPDEVYVFQKGAVRGLGQALFETGREYLVFLKACPPPDLARNNVETSPALPRDSYYTVLEERRGSIAKEDTNAFSKVDAHLRARVRPATDPGPDTPPAE